MWFLKTIKESPCILSLIYIYIPVSFRLHGIKFLSPILETGEQETISYCPGLLFVLGGCVLSVPLSLQEHSII